MVGLVVGKEYKGAEVFGDFHVEEVLIEGHDRFNLINFEVDVGKFGGRHLFSYARLTGKVEHCGEVASGSAENEEVPEFVGREFSGPEFGAFCSVDDSADGVAEAASGDPSNCGGGYCLHERAKDANKHPAHTEVEGEAEPGWGFFASCGDDDAEDCECPLQGEHDVALGLGKR